MSWRPIPVLLALALVWGLGACGSDSSTTAPTTAESTSGVGGSAAPAGGGGKPASGGTTDGAPHQGGASAGRNGSGNSGGGHPKRSRSSGDAVPGENTHFTPPAHRDSGGGARQFEARGGDNSIQESGQEASGSDFGEAAAALHAYLDARAAGAWAVACEYLAPGVYRGLAGQGGGAPGCAEILAGLSAGLPPRALRDVAVADVGSFRVEGDSGFLLFHGAHGVDWFVPMVREDGSWKVAALAPSALP